MGRSMADLLAMKADAVANQEETAELKEDLDLLRKDVLSINSNMNKVIGSV